MRKLSYASIVILEIKWLLPTLLPTTKFLKPTYFIFPVFIRQLK